MPFCYSSVLSKKIFYYLLINTPLATQISMIIVVVDLDCHKCYNKIRKILCQLQGKRNTIIEASLQ